MKGDKVRPALQCMLACKCLSEEEQNQYALQLE